MAPPVVPPDVVLPPEVVFPALVLTVPPCATAPVVPLVAPGEDSPESQAVVNVTSSVARCRQLVLFMGA